MNPNYIGHPGRPVIIDGVRYGSVTLAARALGRYPSAITRLLRKGLPTAVYEDGLGTNPNGPSAKVWMRRAARFTADGDQIRAETARLFAEARRTRWL